MNIEDFSKLVLTELKGRLEKEYSAQMVEVLKNNGVVYHGINIRKNDQCVVPTIYLENFIDEYEQGMPVSTIADMILDIYRKGMLNENKFDVSFFENWESVKNKICFKLINRDLNEKLLDDIPHRDFLDMAICFYVPITFGESEAGFILIHNVHMVSWRVTVNMIYEQALKNTPIFHDWTCDPIGGLITEMIKDRGGEETEEYSEALNALNDKMYVLTNIDKHFGATCILYKGLLDEIARRLKTDFYIIPSSIHEVILITDSGKENPEELKEMIKEVNRTQVPEGEVLSDNLYYYSRKQSKVEIL